MAISASKVLKRIKCDKLDLAKGEGYWYFIYDDVEANIYETESVYTMRLNDMDLDRWVEIGQALVNKIDLNRKVQ